MAKTKIIFLIIASTLLLSYRLLETPMGLTADESAFGRNASLLSRTGYDENGAYLPVFVNSLNKQDWRQPWTQYYQALFFKIFGTSIFNLRFSSVVLIIFSAILIYYLASRLLNHRYGLVAFVIFITIPVVFMHSHLGLDNIMPIPFTLLWLIGLYHYQQSKNSKYLYLSGLSLGASFYAYKGMRAFVPPWSAISFLYIIFLNYRHNIKLTKLISSALPFCLSLFPFILAIPFLSHAYPGAIFGGARPKFDNIYDLFYPYLSHYDPTFLFIKGDDLLFHSTRIHGMYLLVSLPIFLIGIYYALKHSNRFWLFLLIVFMSGPSLFGLVDSVHRASRILALTPIFALLSTVGIFFFYKLKFHPKIISVIFIILFFLNFSDFIKYYWYTYPKFTENIFGNMTSSVSYKIFSREAKSRGLAPYVNRDTYEAFFDLASFPKPSNLIIGDSLPPPCSIYMTFHHQLPGMIRLPLDLPQFNIFVYP